MATNESPEPFYSMSRRAGDMLFPSGFGPVEDGEVVGRTIDEQTVFTMDAMKAVLEWSNHAGNCDPLERSPTTFSGKR